MTLGSAIPPAPSVQLASVAESALEAWLRERGDTLLLIKQILEAQQETQRQLANVARSLEATQAEVSRALTEAARSLASAAMGLATRVEQPAPVVNMTVPEPSVSVTVEAAPVHVQVIEPEEPEKPEKKSREITTVERDSEGRIIRTITEEVE